MEKRWGLTLPLPGLSLADHKEHVVRAEALGYTDFWSGETAGPDDFTPLALSAAWTERVRLGTGIVGVFQRGPALLAQEAAALLQHTLDEEGETDELLTQLAESFINERAAAGSSRTCSLAARCRCSCSWYRSSRCGPTCT